MKQKVLLLDIESAPNLAYCWDVYEQNVLSIEKERKLLCVTYKWLGKREMITLSLNRTSEKKMLRSIHDVMDTADIIIGHNSDRFDFRMLNAFFIHVGLKPTHPYKTVDTLKIARQKFRFNSNKLGDIAEYLNIGHKVETGGFKLWLGCINNDPAAWKRMILYNRRDVSLLEKVYLKIRPWFINHPSIFVSPGKCPACGSKDLIFKGWSYGSITKRRRMLCHKCGRWSRGYATAL